MARTSCRLTLFRQRDSIAELRSSRVQLVRSYVRVAANGRQVRVPARSHTAVANSSTRGHEREFLGAFDQLGKFAKVSRVEIRELGKRDRAT